MPPVLSARKILVYGAMLLLIGTLVDLGFQVFVHPETSDFLNRISMTTYSILSWISFTTKVLGLSMIAASFVVVRLESPRSAARKAAEEGSDPSDDNGYPWT